MHARYRIGGLMAGIALLAIPLAFLSQHPWILGPLAYLLAFWAVVVMGLAAVMGGLLLAENGLRTAVRGLGRLVRPGTGDAVRHDPQAR
jgi:hypothetical protein